MSSFGERIEALRESITYKDWIFGFGCDGPNDQWWLQVHFRAFDHASPETTETHDVSGRKWRLSIHMTDSEIVQTALKAVMTAEEHETREQFLYNGQAIFGPHLDIEQLWELSHTTVHRTATLPYYDAQDSP